MNANSKAAYRRIGEFLEGHNLTIYETLLKHGPLTPWGIASNSNYFPECCLSEAAVFRRMRDLERNSFVERMTWVKDSPSGRACSVWWVR